MRLICINRVVLRDLSHAKRMARTFWREVRAKRVARNVWREVDAKQMVTPARKCLFSCVKLTRFAISSHFFLHFF